MKLTKQNYFTKKNTYITNSKVGDFLKSKELYKKKHIDRTYQQSKTPSMQLGSMVDEYISTGKPESILKKFQVKVKKKDSPQLYDRQQEMDQDCLVSQDLYDKAVAMGNRVVDSNIYYWLKFHKAKFQVPLTAEYSGVPVAGLLDALAIVGDTAYIIDFKTANSASIRSSNSWYWHCKDFGYFRQMAHYGELVLQNYPEVKNLIFRHIVISNNEEENYPVKIFELDPESLNFAGELDVFENTAIAISKEILWLDTVPPFNEVIKLTNPYEDNSGRTTPNTRSGSEVGETDTQIAIS